MMTTSVLTQLLILLTFSVLVVAAFRRAHELGLTLEAVEQGLEPPAT